jgi:hypothetical protein
MHTLISAVQMLGRPEQWPAAHVYVGMPGKAATAYGITNIGPFGKPWHLLDDPRGWEIAYREYLWTRIKNDADFALAVRDLHGKTLVCWCKSKGVTCHAEALAEAAEELFHGIESIGSRPEDRCFGRSCGECGPCMDGPQPPIPDEASEQDVANDVVPFDDDMPWYLDPGGYDIRYG